MHTVQNNNIEHAFGRTSLPPRPIVKTGDVDFNLRAVAFGAQLAHRLCMCIAVFAFCLFVFLLIVCVVCVFVMC